MSSADAILQQLDAETSQAQERLADRLDRTAKATVDLQQLYDRVEAAVEHDDQKTRTTELRILESSLEQLSKDRQAEQEDLAQAVWGLDAKLTGMGQEYDLLQKHDAAEQALIDDAQHAHDAARADLEHLKRRVIVFGWLRRGAMEAAAQARVAELAPRVDEARTEADRRRRQRLLKADMDASLQEIQLRAGRTVDIMEQRVVTVGEELSSVQSEKGRILEDKERTAKALEQCDASIEEKESAIRKAEAQLDELQSGTQEHSQHSTRVSTMRAELEELIGTRNIVLTRHESRENFTAQLEIYEQSLIRLRDNLRMWITALRSDTESRVVTFRARLEAMKAGSDQQVAKVIDDLGAEVDARGAEEMAALGAASDRLRVSRFEDFPARLKRIHDVAVAQVKARDESEARMARIYADFKERWGIDPMDVSFFAPDRRS